MSGDIFFSARDRRSFNGSLNRACFGVWTPLDVDNLVLAQAFSWRYTALVYEQRTAAELHLGRVPTLPLLARVAGKVPELSDGRLRLRSSGEPASCLVRSVPADDVLSAAADCPGLAGELVRVPTVPELLTQLEGLQRVPAHLAGTLLRADFHLDDQLKRFAVGSVDARGRDCVVDKRMGRARFDLLVGRTLVEVAELGEITRWKRTEARRGGYGFHVLRRADVFGQVARLLDSDGSAVTLGT